MKRNALTPKQTEFVHQYLVDLNGKQAAIRAGYSAKTAESQASQMLSKLKVQDAITVARAELREKYELTPEKVVAEMMKVAFARMGVYLSYDAEGTVHLVPSDALPEGADAAIQEVTSLTVYTEDAERTTLKFKLHNKLTALEGLAKHLGLFIDRKEISGPGGGPILNERLEIKIDDRHIAEALAILQRAGVKIVDGVSRPILPAATNDLHPPPADP